MDACECDIWGGVERCPNIIWVKSVQCEFAYESILSKMQTTCSSAYLITQCCNLCIDMYFVWCWHKG